MQTDNSFLADKVALRVEHLPDCGPVRVLDCFAGDGLVWDGVAALANVEIEVLPIEIKPTSRFCLPGNNLAYLRSLDLSRFDVVDLDAYGVPYEQMRILFERKYYGVVFVTFIMRNAFFTAPKGLLFDIGFTPAMVKKIPTLFSRDGWAHLQEYLARNGVTEIWQRSHHRKHYFCIDLRNSQNVI